MKQANGQYAAEPVQGKPIHFLPHFILEAQDRTDRGDRVGKAYLDSIIPAAIEPIRLRETPRRRLLSSVEMAEALLPVSSKREDRSVWGVVTWENVDPRIDFFSVFIEGLTNAYQWENPPGAFQLGDPPTKGRRFARKTLQLNFWRPGDQHLQHEQEVRYGIPPGKSQLYGVSEGVAYQWVYR